MGELRHPERMMQYITRHLLALMVCTTSLVAQDAHYWANQYGAESGGHIEREKLTCRRIEHV